LPIIVTIFVAAYMVTYFISERLHCYAVLQLTSVKIGFYKKSLFFLLPALCWYTGSFCVFLIALCQRILSTMATAPLQVRSSAVLDSLVMKNWRQFRTDKVCFFLHTNWNHWVPTFHSIICLWDTMCNLSRDQNPQSDLSQHS